VEHTFTGVKGIRVPEEVHAVSSDIVRFILFARERTVLLDADLAALYGVTTKSLNQAVKRNAARFPDDFMFRLSPQETLALNKLRNSQASQKHRDPRSPPFAFTEHGAIMLAMILRSAKAIEMMCTLFVRSQACAKRRVRIRGSLKNFGSLKLESENTIETSPRSWPPYANLLLLQPRALAELDFWQISVSYM
jgi:hypothetical protein